MPKLSEGRLLVAWTLRHVIEFNTGGVGGDELAELLLQAKQLAQRYRALTGRPLGVTGEIAESEVVRLLGLELAPVRSAGYDVIRGLPGGLEQRLLHRPTRAASIRIR